ncbi:MAG: tetratricopeptide repeat protein [Candidatus Obscuribacterales bacterium]
MNLALTLVFIVLLVAPWGLCGCAEPLKSPLDGDIAGDFDPREGRWLYAENQHNQKVCRRLVEAGAQEDRSSLERADFLVTAINQYGGFLSDTEKQDLAGKAALLLRSAGGSKTRNALEKYAGYLSEDKIEEACYQLIEASAAANGPTCLAGTARRKAKIPEDTQGDREAAEQLVRRTRAAIGELGSGCPDIERATLFEDLGRYCYRLGRFVEARESLETSLAFYQKAFPDEKSAFLDRREDFFRSARACNSLELGNLMLETGQYRDAIKYFRDGLRINHLAREAHSDTKIQTGFEADQSRLQLGLSAAVRLARGS